MKRWFHIMAHGIGPPTKGKQAYEAEIFNIDGEMLVVDDISKMRDFLDNINLLMMGSDRMLGHKLPFTILEIQSSGSDSIMSEWVTEEWYVYSKTDRIYINIGYASVNDVIDIYNNLNEEYL